MMSFKVLLLLESKRWVGGYISPQPCTLVSAARMTREVCQLPQAALRDKLGFILVPSWEFPGVLATSAVNKLVSCSL